MSFPKSVRSVEIEQQIQYGFTKECIEKFIMDMPVKKYLYIQHGRNVLDKDGLPIEDKEPHYHLYVWFRDPVPTKNIVNKLVALNCKADIQQLEKIKKDDSAIAYATHENCDKPNYPRENAVANFEINQIIDKEVARKNARHNTERANEILEMIDKGLIKEYNLHEMLSIVEYNTYKKDIENGFNYRANRLRNEVDRMVECLFITGESGCGKTTYAKQIASEHGYTIFISSGSNDVLDGYAGQDCVILDDLRPSCMGLSDLLKLLDNNTASTVKSRYRNKILECKMIIVTTTLTIDTFFKNVFQEQTETIVQLKRRCKTLVTMNMQCMKMYMYSDKLKDYEFIGELPNIVLDKYKLKEMTRQMQLEELKKVLGSAGDMLKKVASKVDDYEQMDIREILDNPFATPKT